jgi:hypothetical protein
MTYGSRKPNMPAKAPENTAQGFSFVLKADLGGFFMTAPFTDAAMPEVCARIVFACAVRTYRLRSQDEMSGPECLVLVVDGLDYGKGTLLHSCALAAFYACVHGVPLKRWLATAVLHSRAGLGFRRCWYDDYKANRRDPRVTNRGVKRRSEADGPTQHSARLTKRAGERQ